MNKFVKTWISQWSHQINVLLLVDSVLSTIQYEVQ